MPVLRLKDFDSPKHFLEKRFMLHGVGPDYGGYSFKEEDLVYRLATGKMLFKNPVKNFSVLDVGSGLGHFYNFLRNFNKYSFSYKGIDFNEKVNQAARIYHGNVFFDVDFFEMSHAKRYDFVYCFGVAGIDDELTNLIENLFSISKKGCAVQIFSSHPYLKTYSKEIQFKMMEVFHFISGYRETENSIVWLGEK